MKNNIGLKPCPFCGGKAVIETSNIEYSNYFARCTNCRIQTQWYADKKRLVEVWNRRVDK